jgi:hypothetical protein
MYPVLPLEMNQFAAQSLLLLFTAASAFVGTVFCMR